jgi:hypothetical protein
MHRAFAAWPRGFDSLPSQDPDRGRCPLSFSAGSSKIKIRTSSRHKANLALWREEVRILIFDDPAENERGQHPQFCSAQLYIMLLQHVHTTTKFSMYSWSSRSTTAVVVASWYNGGPFFLTHTNACGCWYVRSSKQAPCGNIPSTPIHQMAAGWECKAGRRHNRSQCHSLYGWLRSNYD